MVRKPWGRSQDVGELFDTPQEGAALFASRWAMIPLTRAMDTLVLNIGDRPSPIKSALAKVLQRRSDFMEWITV